jgi:hypothetical protein
MSPITVTMGADRAFPFTIGTRTEPPRRPPDWVGAVGVFYVNDEEGRERSPRSRRDVGAEGSSGRLERDASSESGLSVLLETVMLTAVASMAGSLPAVAAGRAASLGLSHLLAARAPWRELQLTPPLAPDCARLRGEPLLPCSRAGAGPDIGELPAPSYVPDEVRLPSVSKEMRGTLGGFLNVDMMGTLHLSAGPQLSWLTPESPREDLLRLRVVAPGWGIRYTWQTWGEGAISAGVAVCTRFVMFGEDFPVVDVLTSEARLEFSLP